jgi:hypothetical protein
VPVAVVELQQLVQQAALAAAQPKDVVPAQQMERVAES